MSFPLLLESETSLSPKPNYLREQTFFTEKARNKTAEFIVDVTREYRLRHGTAWLAVSIFDRFAEKQLEEMREKYDSLPARWTRYRDVLIRWFETKLGNFGGFDCANVILNHLEATRKPFQPQLMKVYKEKWSSSATQIKALTCVLMASKQFDVKFTPLKTLAQDFGGSVDEYAKTELEILDLLQWRLVTHPPQSFLEPFQSFLLIPLDINQSRDVQHLIEFSNYKIIEASSIVQAFAAIHATLLSSASNEEIEYFSSKALRELSILFSQKQLAGIAQKLYDNL